MSESIASTAIVAIGLGLFTAGFGVFVEKHYVSRWTIISNSVGISSLALSLNTSQITEFVFLFLYAIAGFALIISGYTFNGVKIVKHFFGSKLYGSIVLVYAFDNLDGSYFSRQILYFIESLGFPNLFDNYLLFFSWLLIIALILVASLFVIVYSHLRRN